MFVINTHLTKPFRYRCPSNKNQRNNTLDILHRNTHQVLTLTTSCQNLWCAHMHPLLPILIQYMLANATLSTKKHLINTLWESLPSDLHRIFRYMIMNWSSTRAQLLNGRHYVLSCNNLGDFSTHKLHMIKLTCSLQCLWITNDNFSFCLFHAISMSHVAPTTL